MNNLFFVELCSVEKNHHNGLQCNLEVCKQMANSSYLVFKQIKKNMVYFLLLMHILK